MNLQYADDMDSGLPGFSSLLAQASSVARGDHRGQMSSPGTLRESSNSSNRNLSAVITRIRDEGPADTLAEDIVSWSGVGRAEKPTPNNAPQPSTDGSADKAVKTRIDACADKRKPASPAYQFGSGIFRRDSMAVKKNGWQPLSMFLVLAVAGGMCFYVYSLADHVEDIIQNLRLQGDDSRPGIISNQPSSDILPLVSGLNDELKSLKSELRVIRDDYRNTENRLSMKIPDELSDQLSKISTAAANDGALQENLERIEREMAEMKKAIESVKTGVVADASSPEIAGGVSLVAASKTASGHSRPAANWVVNLASLSSRDKAQQAVARLKPAGVTPMIQEAVVNGEQVYRLSVAGFFSRADATAFIDKARREFGFDGGWIRQG